MSKSLIGAAVILTVITSCGETGKENRVLVENRVLMVYTAAAESVVAVVAGQDPKCEGSLVAPNEIKLKSTGRRTLLQLTAYSGCDNTYKLNFKAKDSAGSVFELDKGLECVGDSAGNLDKPLELSKNDSKVTYCLAKKVSAATKVRLCAAVDVNNCKFRDPKGNEIDIIILP